MGEVFFQDPVQRGNWVYTFGTHLPPGQRDYLMYQLLHCHHPSSINVHFKMVSS